jgi:RimJ/RimL family protein N-acetyltransferase
MRELEHCLPLPDPPLTDGRVRLRPWRGADLPALVAGAADPLVQRYRYSLPDGEPAARAWLAAVDADRSSATRLELAITAAANGRGPALGSVSLWGFHRRNASAMVSYWLAEPGRGRGLGGAAVTLLSTWAFAQLGLARLGAHVEVDNLASRRLLERCGFRAGGNAAPILRPARRDPGRLRGLRATRHRAVTVRVA